MEVRVLCLEVVNGTFGGVTRVGLVSEREGVFIGDRAEQGDQRHKGRLSFDLGLCPRLSPR